MAEVNKTSVRRQLTAAGRSTGIDSRSAQRRTAVGAVQRAEAWQLDGALWQRGSSRGEPPSKSTIRRSGHGGEGRGRGSKPARQLSHTAGEAGRGEARSWRLSDGAAAEDGWALEDGHVRPRQQDVTCVGKF